MVLAFYKKTDDDELLYYYIHDYQGTLFSRYCITAIWGKGVKPGKKKDFIFEDKDQKKKEQPQFIIEWDEDDDTTAF